MRSSAAATSWRSISPTWGLPSNGFAALTWWFPWIRISRKARSGRTTSWPLTTRFENDSDCGNIKVGYNQIVMQQKVIDPLFEAKTDLWVEREIARRMGIADDVLPKDGVELSKTALSTAEDPYISSLTVEKLEQAGGVWPLENAREVRREYTDYEFDTVSGRMDVYYDSLASFGQALPVWEPCNEIAADNPPSREVPLAIGECALPFPHSQPVQRREVDTAVFRAYGGAEPLRGAEARNCGR